MAEWSGYTQEQILVILNELYERVLVGIENVSVPVEEMADEYLKKEDLPAVAAKTMLRTQMAKCAAAGFLTGLGGLLTLPVSIPANIGSLLYMQIRMSACTAQMAGYDIYRDSVKSLVFASIAGISVGEHLEKAGIRRDEGKARVTISKIPQDVIDSINAEVGKKLVNKARGTSAVHLVKLIPGVGGAVNGGFSLAETKLIADRAFNWFFDGNFWADSLVKSRKREPVSEDNVVNIEDYTFMDEE